MAEQQDQPVQTMDKFITEAMGANSISERLDAAMKLQSYFEGTVSREDLGIEDSYLAILEILRKAHRHDENFLAAYFKSLQDGLELVRKFEGLTNVELSVLNALSSYARDHKTTPLSEMFDHRNWLPQSESGTGKRYTLPARVTGPANLSATSGLVKIVLNFLNVQIPDPPATKGRFKEYSWPMDKFDAHVAERRAAMKSDPALQARDLFLSWFGKASPEMTLIILGHLFRGREIFTLPQKHDNDHMSRLARNFVEAFAMREALAQSDYVLPLEPTTKPVFADMEGVVNLSDPATPLPTGEEIWPVIPPEARRDWPVRETAAQDPFRRNLPQPQPAPARADTVVVPMRPRKRPAAPKPQDYIREQTPRPELERKETATIAAPFAVAAERKKPRAGRTFRRVAAAAAVFVSICTFPDLVWKSTYAQAGHLAETTLVSAKAVFASMQKPKAHVPTAAEREITRRAAAPVKFQDRLEERTVVFSGGDQTPPAAAAVATKRDPYQPTPVRTTREPGDMNFYPQLKR